MRLIDADQFGVIALQGKSKEFIEGVLFMFDKIDEAPTIEPVQDEWIPCSERLPEKNGRYLASWVSNLTNKYNIDSIFFAYGEWDCCNGDVEAWMPLPEPYEGSH